MAYSEAAAIADDLCEVHVICSDATKHELVDSAKVHSVCLLAYLLTCLLAFLLACLLAFLLACLLLLTLLCCSMCMNMFGL